MTPPPFYPTLSQGEARHAKYADQANVTLITVVVRNFRIPVLISVADIPQGEGRLLQVPPVLLVLPGRLLQGQVPHAAAMKHASVRSC